MFSYFIVLLCYFVRLPEIEENLRQFRSNTRPEKVRKLETNMNQKKRRGEPGVVNILKHPRKEGIRKLMRKKGAERVGIHNLRRPAQWSISGWQAKYNKTIKQ